MISNFNIKYWPIVYFKSTGEQIDDNSFEIYQSYYLNLLLKCKNNNEKMILICDLNNINSYPMNFIIKQAEFSKKIYKYNREYVKYVYIYCKNKNFKNILNIFFTFIKPACLYKLCRTSDKIYKHINDTFNIKLVDNIFNNTDNTDNNINDSINYTINNDENNNINDEYDDDVNDDDVNDITYNNEDYNNEDYNIDLDNIKNININ